MAQLSNPAKWPDDEPVEDGLSKMTPHLRRKLGDLGPAFPELRKARLPLRPLRDGHTVLTWMARSHLPAQKVDTADGEVHAVKSVQKYLREHRISGIQNQMAIVTALQAEEVLTDRIYYCLHQLVAGNRGRPPTPQRAVTRPRSSRDSPTLVARCPCCARRSTHPSHLLSPPTSMPCRHDRPDRPLWSSQRVRLSTFNQVKKGRKRG